MYSNTVLFTGVPRHTHHHRGRDASYSNNARAQSSHNNVSGDDDYISPAETSGRRQGTIFSLIIIFYSNTDNMFMKMSML